jgi:hypothetical protein
MSLPAGESLEGAIQQLTQDLMALDEQIHYLVEVVGMNQSNPWAYVVLQRQVDRLLTKKHALQDTYNRAMTELAICRSRPAPQER